MAVRLDGILVSQFKTDPIILLVFVAIVGLVLLIQFIIAASYFRLWFQAYMAQANVSLFSLVAMTFRRTPAAKVVRLKIMAVQAGLRVTTEQIESAILQGADAERAVLAMIAAQRKGDAVSWEDLIAEDIDHRLAQRQLD